MAGNKNKKGVLPDRGKDGGDDEKDAFKFELAPDGRLLIYPRTADKLNQEDYACCDAYNEEERRNDEEYIKANPDSKYIRREYKDGVSFILRESPDEEPEKDLINCFIKPVDSDADTNLFDWTMNHGLRKKYRLCDGGMKKGFGGESPIADAALAAILRNRKFPLMKSLLTSCFTVRITLAQTNLDLHRVITSIPATCSLRAFQDRVLCPLFGWKRGIQNNCEDHAFYLPASAYPSSRRPLKHDRDIQFTVPAPFDFMSMMMRGDPFMQEAEKIDDARVCLADLLQRPGHRLYYKHGKQALLFSLELESLQQSNGAGGLAAVRVLSGCGFNPPDTIMLYREYADVDEPYCIVAAEALNFALGTLQLAVDNDGRIPSDVRRVFDERREGGGGGLAEVLKNVKVFDIEAARKRVAKAVSSRGKVKDTHWPVAVGQAIAPLFGMPASLFGIPAAPTFGYCQMCKRGAPTQKVLKRCSRCQNVRYCSVACQKKDWKEHRHVCV